MYIKLATNEDARKRVHGAARPVLWQSPSVGQIPQAGPLPSTIPGRRRQDHPAGSVHADSLVNVCLDHNIPPSPPPPPQHPGREYFALLLIRSLPSFFWRFSFSSSHLAPSISFLSFMPSIFAPIFVLRSEQQTQPWQSLFPLLFGHVLHGFYSFIAFQGFCAVVESTFWILSSHMVTPIKVASFTAAWSVRMTSLMESKIIKINVPTVDWLIDWCASQYPSIFPLKTSKHK